MPWGIPAGDCAGDWTRGRRDSTLPINTSGSWTGCRERRHARVDARTPDGFHLRAAQHRRTHGLAFVEVVLATDLGDLGRARCVGVDPVFRRGRHLGDSDGPRRRAGAPSPGTGGLLPVEGRRQPRAVTRRFPGRVRGELGGGGGEPSPQRDLAGRRGRVRRARAADQSQLQCIVSRVDSGWPPPCVQLQTARSGRSYRWRNLVSSHGPASGGSLPDRGAGRLAGLRSER